MRRATWFAYSEHSPSTRAEYELLKRRYRANCARAHQDPELPDPDWLVQHITEKLASVALTTARKYVNAIRAIHSLHGRPLITDRPEIRNLLAPRPNPTGVDGNSAFRAAHRRAQYFSENAYHHASDHRLTTSVHRWDVYAREREVDELHAPAALMKEFIEMNATTYSFSTCRNTRNALCYMFRSAGVPDIARSPDVDRVLEGLKRAKPPQETTPMRLDDARTLLASFQATGCDLRNKALTQLLMVGPGSPCDMWRIACDWITVVQDGIIITDPLTALDIFIGSVANEPCFDVRSVIMSLLESVVSGPLFQAWGRLGWTGKALSPVQMYRTIHESAQRANMDSPRIVRAMKLFFRNRVATHFEPTIIAKHLQLRSSAKLTLRASDERARAGLISLRRSYRRAR